MGTSPYTDSSGAALPERYFGLVGRKLGHSYSPRIHARFSEVPYRLIELEPEQLGDFIRNERSWAGLNVTIPYKEDVLALADELSPAVQRIGAANTLVRRPDGSIFADNTDLFGIAWMIRDFCRSAYGAESAPAGAGAPKALVLGSGGASHAVVAALEDAGFSPVVISRSGEETYRTLAERHADAHLLINTTPVGMYPHCPTSVLSPELLGSLTGLTGLIDIVYNPQNTALTELARAQGIAHVASGLPMLVAQAHRASCLFQGMELDESLITETLERISREMRNIVLIGMPGVGKTSAGKRLARLAGRPFIDLDAAVEITCGVSPSEFITENGEEAFRIIETEEVARYGKESGLIIACGGGVVTRPENYAHLHQNGIIVMIDRPIESLSTRNRPITTAKGLEQLAAERMPIYREWADLVYTCSGSADEDAARLKEHFGL